MPPKTAFRLRLDSCCKKGCRELHLYNYEYLVGSLFYLRAEPNVVVVRHFLVNLRREIKRLRNGGFFPVIVYTCLLLSCAKTQVTNSKQKKKIQTAWT